ncbi:MAG TPA: CBS domain-containing protein [Isosphaeraceae bacterium]|nr:CBS domain-containing protein [Isosphaeraceae bacterium]
MAQVREILKQKGSNVLTIDPSASVLEAARVMNEHRVGAVVAVEDGRVLGMFSERDVLQRVVAERRDPADTQVGEVMTTSVVCCTPDTTLDEARGVMRDRRIRHLPVADAEGHLLGLISIGDLNAQIQAAQEDTVFLLTEYIHGRV